MASNDIMFINVLVTIDKIVSTAKACIHRRYGDWNWGILMSICVDGYVRLKRGCRVNLLYLD